MLELEIPQLLLNLMRIYEMNSLMHSKIFAVFADALNSGIPEIFDSVTKVFALLF